MPSDNGYVSKIVHSEDGRGHGVGRALIQAAMGERRQITWVMRTGSPGVAAFHEKLDWSRCRVAVELPGLGC